MSKKILIKYWYLSSILLTALILNACSSTYKSISYDEKSKDSETSYVMENNQTDTVKDLETRLKSLILTESDSRVLDTREISKSLVISDRADIQQLIEMMELAKIYISTFNIRVLDDISYKEDIYSLTLFGLEQDLYKKRLKNDISGENNDSILLKANRQYPANLNDAISLIKEMVTFSRMLENYNSQKTDKIRIDEFSNAYPLPYSGNTLPSPNRKYNVIENLDFRRKLESLYPSPYSDNTFPLPNRKYKVIDYNDFFISNKVINQLIPEDSTYTGDLYEMQN
ncbi:MAG: hypothetical protein GY730_01085 [bacterium]|nr:hypothetical protein [bacterium]